MLVTAGKTSVSVYFYIIQDASASSPGEPVTGLLFSDIETGGSASYVRQGAARVDITLVTLASASASWTEGGFILVDDTNMPGVYRCDVPDAAFATAVDQVAIDLVVASAKNAVVSPLLVDIIDVDLRDAVNMGITALPAFAADAGGGLPISDTGGLDLDTILDAAITTRLAPTVAARTLDITATGAAGIDWANVEGQATAVDLSATDIQLADTVTTLTNLPAITANWLTATGINADAFTAAKFASDVATEFRSLITGTADSGSSTTMVDAIRTEADDVWNGGWILFTSGAIANQCRLIINFVASSDTITFAPPTTAAVGTETYEILPAGAVDVQSWLGVVTALAPPNALLGGAVDADVSVIQADAVNASALATDAVNEIVDQVWEELQSDHVGAGSMGIIASEIASILIDTAEIGVQGAGLLDLGGMSTAMQGEVNTEVDTALDTAISELGVAIPTATPTVRTALMLMYMALRNKTVVQTSGTDALEIYNDAGTIITKKLLTDDGSDYEEAEMTSG